LRRVYTYRLLCTLALFLSIRAAAALNSGVANSAGGGVAAIATWTVATLRHPSYLSTGL
jgi:hypothetical protein